MSISQPKKENLKQAIHQSYETIERDMKQTKASLSRIVSGPCFVWCQCHPSE